MANPTGPKQQEQKGTMQNIAEKASEKARETAGTIKTQAQGAAAAVGERAEQATSSLGSGMHSVADTIREKAPRQGMMGSAASSVASALDSSGHYLEEQGLGGLAEDLTNLIRRNPLPALFIGVGIGFMLARMTRS